MQPRSKRKCTARGVLLAACLLACAQNPAQPEGQQVFVGGKPVTMDVFRAAQLVNESLQLIRSNQNEEAVERLTLAVQLAPELPEARHNLGLAYAKLGRTSEAIAEMQKAIDLKPDLPSTWLTLGGLYQSAGQLDRAIYYYHEFLRRFPSHGEAGKINNLVKGLEAESGRRQAAQESAAEAGDYLAEMTREGTLRWPARRIPIKVCIQSGESVPHYKPQFEAILRQSFEDWSEASSGRVSFLFIKDPARADIVCSWLANPAELTNAAEAGEAHVSTDGQGIVRGTIKILTTPLSAELPLTDTRMQLNCLHEVGHVLGLAGHTMNPADVMFYSAPLTDQRRKLSSRDSNTITKLYSGN